MYYQICQVHGRHFRTCRSCNPSTALIASLRKSIRGALFRKGLTKSAKSLHYLGASSWAQVVDMITRKIENFNKTHKIKIQQSNFDLDHIKPVCAFKEQDMHLCFHWTNLQPLPPKMNRAKSGKWSAKSERFWKRHIILNEGFDQIFLPI